MEYRRLVVDKALEVDLQRLRNVVERLDVDGDGAVLVLGQRGLTLVDHGGELLDGIASALSIFFDTLPHKVRKRTHLRHLLLTVQSYQTFGRKSTISFGE